MLKSRTGRRTVAGVAALVFSVIGVTALAGPAAAAHTGITCSGMSGKLNENANTSIIKLRKCSATGQTAGRGSITGAAAPSPSELIRWATGKTTTIGNINLGTGRLCAGTNSQGFALAVDWTEAGTVTQDNTKSTSIGAAMTVEICYYDTLTPGVLSVKLAPAVKEVVGP
jgi:hypothetical protein